MPLSPEEKNDAVSKFLKEVEGKVDPAALEKAKGLLTTQNPENESLLTVLATGFQNGMATQAAMSKAQQEAAEARRQVEALRQDHLAQTEAIAAYKEYLESSAVPYDQYMAAKSELELAQAQLARTNSRLNELGIDYDDPTSKPQGKQMNTQDNQNGQNGQYQNRQTNTQNPAPRPPFEYVTVERQREAFDHLAGGVLIESAKQAVMLAEHQRLTGQELDLVALSQEATRQGIPPSQLWEQRYDIPKLRAEHAQKAQEDKIEYQVRERVAKALSEERMAGTSSQMNQFKNAGSYAYRAAADDRTFNPVNGQTIPKVNDFITSTNLATEAALREYDSYQQTGKFTDGKTLDETKRALGIG